MTQTRKQLRINGEAADTGASTVLDLLQEIGIGETQSGVAVALNESVVVRSWWGTTELSNGDTVEILRATQGG